MHLEWENVGTIKTSFIGCGWKNSLTLEAKSSVSFPVNTESRISESTQIFNLLSPALFMKILLDFITLEC